MLICNYILLNNDEKTYIPDKSYISIKKDSFMNSSSKRELSGDVIGICSHGNYLTKYGFPLREHYVSGIFDENDMIIPFAVEVNGDSIEALLSQKNNGVEEYIKSHGDIYYEAYQRVIKLKKITSSDVFIAKKDLFYEIFDFIYGSEYSDAPFVRDVLFRVFICAHTPYIRIKEEQLTVKNPDVYQNAVEKSELIYKYMSIAVQNYIEVRKQDGFDNSIIEDIECEDDFDNKIPVWICWWQGIEELPEMVKACISSVKRNLPKEKTVIRFITLENVGKYVTFTDTIVHKFNEGKISYTHLAEALRSELIYRYGGLWIDATYYVSKPIPESFFDKEYFSIAFENPEFGPDISEAKWSTSIWYLKPKSRFMQFLTELKWTYWESQESVIDYFIFDYEVALAYRVFPEFRKMIDDCEKTSPAVYELQLRMNQNFNQAEKNRLVKGSVFYKLNRRYEYVRTSLTGSGTVYDYICSEDDSDYKMDEETFVIELNSVEELKDKFELIRAKNPSRILDKAYAFVKAGFVSKSLLETMLSHSIIIDTIYSDRSYNQLPIDNGVYANIYKDFDISEKEYDLVIVLK